MTLLSLPALITWVGIPSVFALILARIVRQTTPSDRNEKQTLLVMLAPFGLGASMVLLAGQLPIAPIALADRTSPPGVADAEALTASDAVSQVDLPSLLWVIGLGYLAVTIWRCIGWLRGVVSLFLLTRESVPVPFAADVLISPRTKTPLIHPSGQVILPDGFIEAYSQADTQMVLAHERAHHDRGDQVYFIFLALLDAVFWCHPGLRWQTERCRLAAELACDEAACAAFPTQRKSYAQLIVRALRSAHHEQHVCAPTAFSSRSQGEIRMRLQSIVGESTSPSRRPGVFVMIALLTVPLLAGQWALAKDAIEANFSVPPIEKGKVTSRYGLRTDPFSRDKKSHHYGLDIAAPRGTIIRAPALGVVSNVSPNKGNYGNFLEITHADKIVTRYTQLETIKVEVGDRVRAGETVATVGSTGRSTGPHLHLEVFVDGKRVDPETLIALPTEKWRKPPRFHDQ